VLEALSNGLNICLNIQFEFNKMPPEYRGRRKRFLQLEPVFTNRQLSGLCVLLYIYEGWNFNSGNYLFTTDTK